MSYSIFRFLLPSLLLCVLSSAVARAQSGGGIEHGRGGDAIRLPDGRVVLADDFFRKVEGVKDYPGDPLVMGNVLSNNLKQIWKMLQPYGAKESFLADHVLERVENGRSINIYQDIKTPEALEKVCVSRTIRSYSLEAGGKPFPIACSIGKVTFIILPLFLELSPLDRVRSILHERLGLMMSPDGGFTADDAAIMEVSKGIKTLWEVFKRQSELNDRRPISGPESLSLSRMIRHFAKYFEAENAQPRTLTPHGGIALTLSKAPSGFISAGSSVGGGCKVDPTAEILVSQVDHGCEVGKKARIINSLLTVGVSPAGSHLGVRRLHRGRTAPQVGANSKVVHSRIGGLWAGARASVELVSAPASDLFKVGNDATVFNLTLKFVPYSEFAGRLPNGRSTKFPLWSSLAKVEFESGALVKGLGLNLTYYGQTPVRSELIFESKLEIDSQSDATGKLWVTLQDWSWDVAVGRNQVKRVSSATDLQ